MLGKAAQLFKSPLLTKLLLLFFAIQGLYLLFSIRIGLPPDELTHIRFIEYYANNSLLPFIGEQTDAFYLGDITRTPNYLFHYLMSLLLRLTQGFSTIDQYIMLRFASFTVAFLTVATWIKTALVLRIPRTVINLSLVIVLMTSEFIFIASAVNSDQLVWLFTALGFLLVVLLWEKVSVTNLLFLTTVVAFGSITKKTFLPIALLFVLFGLYYFFKHRKKLLKQITLLNIKLVVPLVVTVISVGMLTERIGYNLWQYQQIDVSCDKIHTVEACSEFGVFRRNYRLANTPAYPQVLSPHTFSPAWLYRTTETTFGLQGWPGTVSPGALTTSILFVLFVGVTSYGLIIHRKLNRQALLIFYSSVFFVITVGFVNYGGYQKYGIFGLALQGRYIFAVLIPIILIGTFILAKAMTSERNRLLLSGLVIFLLLTNSGLPLILRSNNFLERPLRPALLFDRENAITKYEPGI